MAVSRVRWLLLRLVLDEKTNYRSKCGGS
jgi:hypothetical protein